MLIKRIGYACLSAFRHRQALLTLYRTSDKRLASIEHLHADRLRAWGVKILVLDFDGVLSAHGEVEVCDKTHQWLTAFLAHWDPKAIVILSNKPFAARREAFSRRYPDIEFHIAQRKKPYPDGLHAIMNQKAVRPNEIVLVDDRWLTGMLAACIAGCQGIHIESPKSNFKKRPVKEMFFAMLRGLENQILRWFY